MKSSRRPQETFPQLTGMSACRQPHEPCLSRFGTVTRDWAEIGGGAVLWGGNEAVLYRVLFSNVRIPGWGADGKIFKERDATDECCRKSTGVERGRSRQVKPQQPTKLDRAEPGVAPTMQVTEAIEPLDGAGEHGQEPLQQKTVLLMMRDVFKVVLGF